MFLPKPRELEKRTDWSNRFVSDTSSKEEFPLLLNRQNEANRLWKDAWSRAQVTVISSQGDFFINR